MDFLPAEFIHSKRFNHTHTAAAIDSWIKAYLAGHVTDYQMTAWLMAVAIRGMEAQEIAALTQAMRDSGTVLDFRSLGRPVVDKHSTGGVGDKTTLLLLPILAAHGGLSVPMLAGRGLGHTGGTLDKLESIPGFRWSLTLEEFQRHMREYGVVVMGQTEEICPADRRLYALRDVTGTVDSLPLITASIMSKKLAEGLDALVLDVKYGSGAFMKTRTDAEALARMLKSTGEASGLKVTALLTDMSVPLGRFIGNALEVKECLAILRNETHMVDGADLYAATRNLSLHLAGHILFLAGAVTSVAAGEARADELIRSGAALKAFHEICARQGGGKLDALPEAEKHATFKAPGSGHIKSFDCEKIGYAAIHLGAGRKHAADVIDPAAGLEIHVHQGQWVEKGATLFTLYHGTDADVGRAVRLLEEGVTLVSR